MFKSKFIVDKLSCHTIIIALTKKALKIKIFVNKIKKSEKHEFPLLFACLNTYNICYSRYRYLNNTHTLYRCMYISVFMINIFILYI